MKINGATQKEKDTLAGMIYILNRDLCIPFDCPEEGCDNCPIHDAEVYLNKAITVLLQIPVIEGE